MELRACVRQIATRAFVPRLVSILVFPLAIGIAGADTPAERTLHRFDRLIEGTRPFGLVAGANGALYGVTFEGGFNGVGCYNGVGCGTVFSLTPTASGYRERVLYRFKGTVQHVVIPGGGLLIDGSGTLYGTLWWTGSTFAGSVYKLTFLETWLCREQRLRFSGAAERRRGPFGRSDRRCERRALRCDVGRRRHRMRREYGLRNRLQVDPRHREAAFGLPL